jgi:glycosyltransferase involved in cell wall biosynthesis
MHFLFCCEFYYPSVGGVQEVMRQIAERMVRRGHKVTVATTQMQVETFAEWNGVQIEHFAVTGNEVRGISGEADRYRDFVRTFPADALLIKAAQQWTFDALFPILDQIKTRKIFIPCGFSGFYEPAYKGYFERLPTILRKFDQLIFYASHYRDIDFCRTHGLTRLSFIPNGASESEFHTPEESPGFRKSLGIAEDSFVFSTVGSLTGVKGHRELAEAFLRMDNRGHPVTLVLNGNQNLAPAAQKAAVKLSVVAHARGFLMRCIGFLRREGLYRAARRCAGATLRFARKTCGEKAATLDPISEIALRVNSEPGSAKQMLIVNLPRGQVIDLFKTTNLFVFASNIEYSPLVLFEAAAAGTPFLTVPVGNAEEIALLTGAGVVCPAPKDGYGYTRVEPAILAEAMTRMMNDPTLLSQLGQAGRVNWEQKFTWDSIASQYEALLVPDAVLLAASPKPPIVSVLLPVVNGGTALSEAVRSILRQTLHDFELLIIDDGSSDGAIEKIRAIGDSRIRILGDQTRRGLSARLNEGIDSARGLYIARMDADDIAFPRRLEKQVQYLESNPDIDLTASRAVVFQDSKNGEPGRIIGLLPFAASHNAICARPWRGFPLPHPTWLGRTGWFRRFHYAQPEVARAEDQELLLRSYTSSRFACLDEVLLGYRQGAFDLGKTLKARGHLLVAQQHYFLRHRHWKLAALTLASTVVKVFIDCLAFLPGCDGLYFTRMSESVPDQVVRDLTDARRQDVLLQDVPPQDTCRRSA